VTRYVVDVMPKREILDPQGKAVLGALPRLGFEGVTDVRQGKRFEVDLDGEPGDERLDEVRRMAETLLANPVIEDFTVTVAADPSSQPAGGPMDEPADGPMEGDPAGHEGDPAEHGPESAPEDGDAQS
jgi:phosphoribosylformylglycinamidine synthase subunit PurS